MADKVDFKKSRKDLFSASSKQFEKITLPPASYLMVDGVGAPGGPEYVAALGLLYPVAYGLKFYSKTKPGRDYVVPPLEGLWWADDRSAYTEPGRRDEWKWTLMLMLPDWIEASHVEAARAKKADLDLSPIRMEAMEEGLCFSHLHLGPFSAEASKLHRLHHELIPEGGYAFNGEHHEIYLSDPRKTAPEKLRTILRQPVSLT